MNDSKTFEIDFSEAMSIPEFFEKTVSVPSTKSDRLHKIWGFSSQAFGEKASGAATLGTVLHFHEIGWNHLPKLQNGRPVNDPYLAEIMRWSASPDLQNCSMGASPSLMLKSLRKASLVADWYAGNTPEKTLALVKNELNQQRPVITLINHSLQGYPLQLEWQVIFHMDELVVHTKHSNVEDGTLITDKNAFIDMISMTHPQLSCSIITARKE